MEESGLNASDAACQITGTKVWLAPWLLVTMLLDWVSVRTFQLLLPLVGEWQATLGSSLGSSYYGCLLYGLLYSLTCVIAYAPASAAAAVSFSVKLQQHGFMLSQLEGFDVHEAKCTVSADRPILEAEIAAVYDEIDDLPLSVALDSTEEAWPRLTPPAAEGEQLLQESNVLRSAAVRSVTSYPSVAECLELFNADVRGPLRRATLRHCGGATDLPLATCMQAFLPFWLFLLSSNFLSYDGYGSLRSALKAEGYQSVLQLYAADCVFVLLSLATMPTTFPLLLLRLAGTFGLLWLPAYSRAMCSRNASHLALNPEPQVHKSALRFKGNWQELRQGL